MDGLHYLGAIGFGEAEHDDASMKATLAEAAKKEADAKAAAEKKKATASSALKTVSSIFDAFTKPSTPTLPGYVPEQSWFTRPVLGPVPGLGVLAIGAAVLTAGGLIIKKVVSR